MISASTHLLENTKVVVFGGTGSLGQKLVSRILAGECGVPNKLVIISRDEAKQYQMKIDLEHQNQASTQEIIYKKGLSPVEFVIGDIRDFASVEMVLRDADYVFSTAALKQVPTCEYFPFEAVKTNCIGMQNIIHAVKQGSYPVKMVLGISTDKACKPVNVMGMTKALQERMLVQANLNNAKGTRFGAVRYGNVVASRGSVVPLFSEQITRGGPVTVTTETMTRFLLTLDQAVDTIFASVRGGTPGDIYVPIIPSARIIDVARAIIDTNDIEIKVTGIRPGEKEHEIMISEEESYRTIKRDGYYVILPMLPELQPPSIEPALKGGMEYSSNVVTMDKGDILKMLRDNNLLPAKTEAALKVLK